jgi:hypothetical protein
MVVWIGLFAIGDYSLVRAQRLQTDFRVASATKSGLSNCVRRRFFMQELIRLSTTARECAKHNASQNGATKIFRRCMVCGEIP